MTYRNIKIVLTEWITRSIVTLLFLLTLNLSPSVFAQSSPATAPAEAEDPGLLSNTRQLTFAGERTGEGYFSADGSKMVFQSEREAGNPFYQIYWLDLVTGKSQRVSPGYGKTTCAWIHPSDEKILFSSTHADPEAKKKQEEELELRASGEERRYSWDFDPQFDLYEASVDGTRLNRLTDALGYDAEGSWSPDGSLIVFASNRHAYSESLTEEHQTLLNNDPSFFLDIYLMDADGSNVRRLTNVNGYDGGPFFNPDGTKIIWRRFSENGASAEIYTMDIDGGNQKQITHLGAMSWAPYFHPSGDYAIFATNLHGFDNFELYLTDAEGIRDPVRVTTRDGFDGLPVFSPDGAQLAWTSNQTPKNQSQLFAGDWDDSKARDLLGLHPSDPLTRRSIFHSKTTENKFPHPQTKIRKESLQKHIEFLASEKLEGRLTGTPGELAAAEYVARVFAEIGLEPAANNETYIEPFEFTGGLSLGSGNALALNIGEQAQTYELNMDWRPLAFSDSATFGPAEIVFAGYGIVTAATQEFEEYDSYVHLDVQDKWVMMFRYLPEEISPELRQHLSQHSSLRYKAMMARDRGALGLLIVSGPNSQVKEELVPLSFDASIAGTSVAVMSVSDNLGQAILAGVGKDLKELQEELDTGEPVMGFPIPGITAKAEIDIRPESRTGHNVLGLLRAGSSSSENTILIGAHLDHIGRGGSTSLGRDDEKGKVHPGADDNASGTAAMLEIAGLLADLKATGQLAMKSDLLFAAWSGEELGMLGSNHFIKDFKSHLPQEETLGTQITAYLNLDMVGRLRKNLILQGVGSSSFWLDTIEENNFPAKLPIQTQDDCYLPTDATAFYVSGIPILSAFTGAHEEYNTPRDTPESINYDGLENISSLMASIARSLVTREDPIDYIEIPPATSARRANLRAYLGTIPDYSQTDAKGVKLSGVAGGGPADVGGIQTGDIVVEVAGTKIDNIYDYTYAIEALKIGQPVAIVVIRQGERLSIEVTPGSRE